MVTLVEHPLSPYAQKVKIALREKGVPFSVAAPDPTSGDLLQASPRGEVPVLIHDDVRIFDSTIILEYVEEVWPDPPLAPAAPAERARARMIEEVMDTHYEAINWALGEIRAFRRAEGALAERLVERARIQTEGFQAWLTDRLGAAAWFNGDRFGWADIAVAPFVNGSVGSGFAPAAGSPLALWLARANARPSVAQTNAEAASAAPALAAVADLLRQGLFKREYRDHRLEWMVKSGGLEIVRDGLAAGDIRFAPDHF